MPAFLRPLQVLGLCQLAWWLLLVQVYAFVGEPTTWRYQPSVLERTWLGNVQDWSDGSVYCSRVNDYERHIDYWLTHNVELMKTRRLKLYRDDDNQVFSAYHKFVQCDRRAFNYTAWIEPLAFCLRHPAAPCNRRKLLDRDYLLLSSIIDVQYGSCGRPVQKFYFDLGASVWNTGAGGNSQKFLVNAYRQRGITFDRMLVWEGNSTLTSEEIFRDVPRDILGQYSYYHFNVTVDPLDPANPLNILKAITKDTDFVAFKLDIDNDTLENALMTQILDDPEVYSRIDEFFFEHHVNFQPMREAWGKIKNATLTLPYSYWLFSELRRRGIRAHGWP